MMLGVWAYTFPESPKFLMEAGDAERALEVLRYMYTKNTGNHYIQYAVSEFFLFSFFILWLFIKI